jgi:hypothetical protein
MSMKFTADIRAYGHTGHYTDVLTGRWTIVNTARNYWELRLDGCKVMGYTSFAAAKGGAAEYETK